MPAIAYVFAILLVAAALPASEIRLQSPLTTVVRAERPPPRGDCRLEAWVVVPDDAPADLGVGAFLADAHGRWFQRCRAGALAPGRHHLMFALGADADLIGEPHLAAWDAHAGAVARQGGLFFWSTRASETAVLIESLAFSATPAATRADTLLADLRTSGERARTGERWWVRTMPTPFPANPYDPDEFALDAAIIGADGATVAIPGFFDQPMQSADRGDAETVDPTARGWFEVRWRPQHPGRYRVKLSGRWRSGRSASCEIPLVVDGDDWDGYVRVDRDDPRFFSIDHRFYWPVGLNLRSVWDLRCQERLETRLTPNRGLAAYDAYLRRLVAGGGDAAEIWLSSWNLALEWRGDWPFFYGAGRYSEVNAWRLDRLLDLADQLDVRINLVLNNHGQASDRTDHEWENSPFNRERGGTLSSAREIFTSPQAAKAQENFRRYVVARYSDHPAILGWKLWSENNLTAGDRGAVRTWHEKAEARWHALDPYHHPVTTHWSGDFRQPEPAMVSSPGLDYVCIDAYHGHDWLLAELLFQGMSHPQRGLGRFHKPIVVTEYGGNWDAAPESQMLAEHATGAWAALVSGYGGSPMLWWFEWVDQRNQWAPYAAIARFLHGEDLRSPDAKPIVLATTGAMRVLWAHAWSRPGRILGYLLDQEWAMDGGALNDLAGIEIEVGSQISAGHMVVEWWDADRGALLRTDQINHPGGRLAIAVPAFNHHLAFKLARASGAND